MHKLHSLFGRTDGKWFTPFGLLLITSLIWAVAFPIGALVVGIGVHANWLTVLYGSAMSLLLALGLLVARRLGTVEIMTMLVGLVQLFFLPRHMQYVIMTRASVRNLYVLFPVKWTPEMINLGLTWVLAGTSVLMFGIVTAGYVLRGRLKPDGAPVARALRIPMLPAVVLASVVVFAVDCYFSLYLGQSAAMNCVDETIRGKWLIHFFSGDMVLFATMVIFGPSLRKLTWRQYGWFAFLIFAYLIYTLALGSRGGVMRVAVITFALLVAWNPLQILKARLVLSLAPIVIILGVAFFFIGTNLRYLQSSACANRQTDLSEAVSIFEQNFLSAQFLDPVGSEAGKRDAGMISLSPTLAKVFDRLGVLDYPIGVVVVPGDAGAKAQYMNWTYMAKNLMNNLVIGVPFPEAEIMTSSLMPIIYRGFDERHVRENFLSEMWTLWGSSYVLGGPVGGILMLFAAGFLLQFAMVGVGRRLGSFEFYWKCCCIWMGCAVLVFFHMAIDHAAFVSFVFFFQSCVVLGLMYGLDRLLSAARKGLG